MWLFTFSLLMGLCAGDEQSRHDQAVAAITQLGGIVEIKKAPDEQLIVGLTAAGKPNDCIDMATTHALVPVGRRRQVAAARTPQN